MIVLDTNVASELIKAAIDPVVLTWLRRGDQSDHFLTATSVMEMWFGAERIFLRNRSSRLLDATEFLIGERFVGRVLPLGAEAAALAGRIHAGQENVGRGMSVQDAQIAAICLFHGATLATRNIKDFEGLDLRLVNPFEEP